MNAENFHEYLKNPSLLYQANYQELKSLVVQYPYSSNLRLLVLLKSLIDNHKDFDRNLVLASMYGIDRAKLKEHVNNYERSKEQAENVVITEDYLELKDLSEVEDLPEKEVGEPLQAMEQPLDVEEMFMPEEPTSPTVELADLEDEADFLEDIPLTQIDEKKSTPNQPPLLSLEDLMSDDFSLEEEEDFDEEAENKEQNTQEENEEEDDVDAIFDTNSPDEDQQDEFDKIVEKAIQNARDKLLEKGKFLNLIDDAAAMAGFSDQLLSGTANTEEPEEATTTPDTRAEEAQEKEEPNQEERHSTEDAGKEHDDDMPQEQSAEEETLSPTPTPNFSSWLQQLQPPQVSHEPPAVVSKAQETPEAGNEKEEKTVADEAKELAAKSVVENFDIGTETLAAILEEQGHYQKAIAIYERLMLKYPEKKAFFAAKIEELKSK